jgi:hypothetical protein
MTRNDADRIGRWFEVIGSLGRNETNLFRRAVWNSEARTREREEVRDYPHHAMDGLGAMVTFMRELGDAVPFPVMARRAAPRLWKRAQIVIGSQRLARRARAEWKRADWDGRESGPEDFHVLCFDERETGRIQKHCSERGISLTALLCTLLQQCAAPLLADPESTQAWYVPVNMRGGVNGSDLAANHSSAIPIFVSRRSSAEDAHTQLRALLKAGVHWGNWWAYASGARLPKRLMKWMYERYTAKTFWMGTVSDMGTWTTGPQYRSLGANEVWFAAPPGCRNYPITCLPLTFDGRMTITVKVHPSVSAQADASRELAEALQRGLEGTTRPLCAKR